MRERQHTSHPRTVVVVGDAALDVVARHEGALAHGDDTPASVLTAVGGAGANTATWLVHLGVPTTLVTRVGADPAAGLLRGGLANRGVACALTTDPGAATGCVVVLVDSTGQRTMLPDRGANARLRAEDLPDLGPATHLHLSGYVLLDDRSRQAGLAALRRAAAAGLTTSVDPQSAALLDGRTDDFLTWVEGVDLLLPNATELEALGVDRALRSVEAIASTDGRDGATWRDGTTEVSVPAGAGGPDTTGAGDAFNAGLLAAWLGGAGPVDALRAGVAAGTSATLAVGASPR
ncbi:carbohydrate kinase family protein [Actinokineospora pegani]|uniref:carbohydrate kinase family protein n=1 Tax=Actinokineospora pegani TaxID=2654637 RepID=UPI0012EA6698|nr:PfkB family carbohydrate kinase [Actinokineospora pegani]